MCGASAFASYVAGLATTIACMTFFDAAQPALLYIVPAVLGGVGIHAALKREFNLVRWIAALHRDWACSCTECLAPNFPQV